MQYQTCVKSYFTDSVEMGKSYCFYVGKGNLDFTWKQFKMFPIQFLLGK